MKKTEQQAKQNSLRQLGWGIVGFEGHRLIFRILCTAAKQACRYLLYSFCILPPPPKSSTAPSGPGPLHVRGFTIILRHTTLGRVISPTQRPLLESTQQLHEKDIYASGGIRTFGLLHSLPFQKKKCLPQPSGVRLCPAHSV